MMKRIGIVLAAALFVTLPALAIADDSAAMQTPQGQTQPPQGQTQPPPAQTQPPPAQTPPPAQAPPPAQTPPPTPKIEKVTMPEGPPAELKKLSMLKGAWASSMHMYASPMGPESTSPAKATYDWSFNGMHIEGNHQFQMNGKPCFGRSTWGWDPEKQQYQVIWVDAMYPAGFVYYGTFANDNTLVLYTTYMLQGKAVTEKMTYAFSDPDNYTMVMESDMSGEMKPMMEEKGARGKAASKTASKPAQPKKPAAATTPKKSG
jgi:uncharacterized protein DUF1579